MTGGQCRGNAAGIDASGFGQRQCFGQDAIVAQHQDLIDHLGRLSGADAAHMGKGGGEIGHHRGNAGHGLLVAAGHDGEGTGLGRRRAAGDRGIDPAHAIGRSQAFRHVAGGPQGGGRMIDQQLALARRLGDAVGAEDDSFDRVGRGHAKQQQIRAGGGVGRRTGGRDTMFGGPGDLVLVEVVAQDRIAAAGQAPGEGLAHQAEADEADDWFHGHSPA